MNKLLLFLSISLMWCIKVPAQDSTAIYENQIDSLINKKEFNKSLLKVDLLITYNNRIDKKNGNAFLKKGIIFHKKGELDSSLASLLKAENDFSAEKDTSKMAFTFLRMGQVYKNKENYPNAIKSLNNSLTIYEKLNDTLCIGIVKMTYANILKGIGNIEPAIENYNEALNIFENLNNRSKISACYNNIGILYKNINNLDSSSYYYHKSLRIKEELPKPNNISYAYHNLADLHLTIGDIDSAYIYINESLLNNQATKNQVLISRDYTVLGDIYYKKNDLKNAVYYYQEALKLKVNEVNNSGKRHLYKSLGKCYSSLGDHIKASNYYGNYISLLDAIQNENQASIIENELINYELIRDSLQTNQWLLQKELSEIEKNNLQLQEKINKNNTLYLFIILAILIVLGGLLYISFRKRLKQSNSHKKTLEAQNEELVRTLISKEEKETLLKEIHHRVKNNLQIIISLFRLQSHYMTTDNFMTKIVDMENRIRSMSMVHEKLYKTENLSKLNAKNYIEDLVTNILSSIEVNTKISVDYTIEDVKFNIDSLIPLGLIINEIVSNSIKYAFDGKDNGKILIHLSINKNQKTTIFTISDNGIGTNINIDELTENSLGIELINSLAEQLNGTFKINTKNGFEYFFNFPPLD